MHYSLKYNTSLSSASQKSFRHVILHNVLDTVSNYYEILKICSVFYCENNNWLVSIVVLQLRRSMCVSSNVNVFVVWLFIYIHV